MIGLIARANSSLYVQGLFRLADPDALLDIALRGGGGLDSSEDAWQSEQFSRVLHDIRMGGVWKRTNSGRLKATERMLCKHIVTPEDGRPMLLDIGASDGVTTVELLRSIRHARGVEAKILLGDINLRLDRYRLGPLVEYRAVDGEPVMVRVGRFGMRLGEHRRVKHRLRDSLSRGYLRLVALRRAMRIDAQISLVNPIVSRESAITVREMDCLKRCEDLVGRFVAVRASNVFNLGYFGADEIHRALDHIFAYLRRDGCLVVSRNADQSGAEIENGSVWNKSNRKFSWIEDFGSGSEVKDVVESWRVGS